MNNSHAVMIVVVIALVTLLLRFFPFLIFNGKHQTPVFVTYLGHVLPYSIMGMLVVYCLKAVSLMRAPYGLPELFACLIVILLHIWKRNTLLSIGIGTISYMLLIQYLF